MITRTKTHTVYKTKEDIRVPSVTTVLGILNKPALLDWAWKCGRDGLDYRKVRDDAASVGTLAHYLILCHLRGEKPDLTEFSAQDIDRAETCLIKYFDWESQHDFKSVLVEAPLVSEQYKFGGTVDCVARMNGELVLIDHKTGKAIYPEMFAQLAAYRQLLIEAGYNITSARILRIGRDSTEGFEERVANNLDRQWQIFQHCLAIYELQKGKD